MEVVKLPSRRGGGPGKGRRAYAPTPNDRRLVHTLVGYGVSQELICAKYISPPVALTTFRKAFKDELQHAEEMAATNLKAKLHRAANTGNVRAQIYLLERFYWRYMPPPPPVVPSNAAQNAVLGESMPGEESQLGESGVYIVIPDNGRGFPPNAKPSAVTIEAVAEHAET